MQITSKINAQINHLQNEIKQISFMINQSTFQIDDINQSKFKNIQVNFLNLNQSIISKYILNVKNHLYQRSELKIIYLLCQIMENMCFNPQHIQNELKNNLNRIYQQIIQELKLSNYTETQQDVSEFNIRIINKIKQLQPSIQNINISDIKNENINQIKVLYSKNLNIVSKNYDDQQRLINELIQNLRLADQALFQIQKEANNKNMNEYLIFQFYYLLIFQNNLRLYQPYNTKQILQRCSDILQRQFQGKQNQLNEIVQDNQVISMGPRNKLFLRRLTDHYEKILQNNSKHKQKLKNISINCQKLLKQLILRLNVFGSEYQILKKLEYSLVNKKLINKDFKKQQLQIQNICQKIRKCFKIQMRKQISEQGKEQLLILKNKFINLVKQMTNFKKQRGLRLEQNISIQYVEKIVEKLSLELKMSLRKKLMNQQEESYFIEMNDRFDNKLKQLIKQDIQIFLKNTYLNQYAKYVTEQDLFHQKYSLSSHVLLILDQLKRKLTFSKKKLNQINKIKPIKFQEDQEERSYVSHNYKSKISQFKYSLPKLAFIENYLVNKNIQSELIDEINNEDFVLQKINQDGFEYERPNNFQQFYYLSPCKKKQFLLHEKWLYIQNMNLGLQFLKTSVIENQLNNTSSNEQFEMIPMFQKKLGEEINILNQNQDKYSQDLSLTYKIQSLNQELRMKQLTQIKKDQIYEEIIQLKKGIKQQYQYCKQFIQDTTIKQKLSKNKDIKFDEVIKKQLKQDFFDYMKNYFSMQKSLKQDLPNQNPINEILQTCQTKLGQIQLFQKQLEEKQIEHKKIQIFCHNLKNIDEEVTNNKIELNETMNDELIRFSSQLNHNDVNKQMNDFYNKLF